MSISSILNSLGPVIGGLASAIVPGAANIEKLIEAGKALSEAFQTLKGANGGTAPAEAEAQHDALMAKVNAHADGTLGRLEGGGE